VLRAKTDSAVRREGGSGSFRVAAPGAQPDFCATRTPADVGGEYELHVRLFISCCVARASHRRLEIRSVLFEVKYVVRYTEVRLLEETRATRVGNFFFLQI